MKSPLKFFFTAALVFLAMGAICDLIWHSLANSILSSDHSSSRQSLPYDLALADYHLASGAVDTAIHEYKIIADTDESTIQTIAKSRLNQILSHQQNFGGRLAYIALQILWSTYPRFYGISGLLIFIWGILLIFKWTNKRSSFAILPMINSTDIVGVDELSTLVIERIQEIQWKTRHITPTINRLISEQLEIPSIGFANDGKNIDLDKIIETAWALTSGNSNLSLAELMRSLRLWINAPQYIINGSLFEVDDSVQLRLFMLQSDTGKLERTWLFSLPATHKRAAISVLMDDIAFALFHYFNEDVSTKNWRALQAATKGILYFELYFADKQIAWLDAARKSLESAILLDPEYIVARYNLGLVFMAVGQFDAARTILKPITLK